MTKILLTIKDENIFRTAERARGFFKFRRSSRGVFFDSKNKIPLMYVGLYNYHKLPGGKIELNENYIQTLRREFVEEVSCELKNIKYVGSVIELRQKTKTKEYSHGFFGYLSKIDKPVKLTKKEKEQGLAVVWTTLENAIKIVRNDKPLGYQGKFHRLRDLSFLQEVERIISSS